MNRIRQARQVISREFQNTPQYVCHSLGDVLGCELVLKIETMNPIRCFKGRGSELALQEAVSHGFSSVVCASAGNLGQAVAYCGSVRHASVTVYASRHANQDKLRRIKRLGAKLQLVDGDIEHARAGARRESNREGAYLIEDSENIATCEGAATIGLELADQQAGDLDAVLLALGGGALATGVGRVMKERSTKTQVCCVQPAGAPAMTLSYRKREVVNTEQIDTIADGVAGRHPIGAVLDDLLQVADDALLVQEASIMQAMKLLYMHSGIVAEPSAALGVAAILENRDRFAGQRIATVICGSNVASDDFFRWIGAGTT